MGGGTAIGGLFGGPIGAALGYAVDHRNEQKKDKLRAAADKSKNKCAKELGCADGSCGAATETGAATYNGVDLRRRVVGDLRRRADDAQARQGAGLKTTLGA